MIVEVTKKEVYCDQCKANIGNNYHAYIETRAVEFGAVQGQYCSGACLIQEIDLMAVGEQMFLEIVKIPE